MTIESIKITSLNNIGANLSYNAVFPVVNITGTPETYKANLQIIGNYILSQAGGANMVQALQSTFSQSVTNAAQPNITSVGTLTTLSVSPGNISGNTNGYTIGYLNVPQVLLTANTSTTLTDAGKHYYSTSSSNLVLTISNNTQVSSVIGTSIKVVNGGTGNITLAQGTGVTLYLAGNATSGNRTISSYGVASLIKVNINTWFIEGTGVA